MRTKLSRRLSLETLESRALFAGDCSFTAEQTAVAQGAAATKTTAALSAAVADDRYEENDTRAVATNLGTVSGTATFGSLALADTADWYRFTINGTGTSTSAAAINFLNSQGDLDVELYNASGTLLVRSQGTGNSERLSLSGRAAGSYFLRVYGYRNATNPSYSLTITAPGQVVDDSYEDNDTVAAAKSLGALTTATTVNNLVLADSADWFKFSMAGTGTTADFVSLAFQNAQGDLDLEVYNAAGTRVGLANGTGNSERVSLSGLAAGSYSVRIYGYNGATNPTYSLTIDPAVATTAPPTTPPTVPPTTPSTGAYDIQIVSTGLTASQAAIFEQAAARWEQIITGDLPNATYNGVTVDDLLINASSVSIDGAGGVLGQAGPDRFRSGTQLPYHGTMQFDSADLASMERNGTLLGVIEHEIGHVLGIGTLWSSKGLLVGAGTAAVKFTGAQATAAYNSIFGTSATGVPVESDGGSGTADSHWDDTLFGSEIMTGYIGPAAFMPISRITVGSLADIGYSVNMAAADAYTKPGVSSLSAARATSATSSSSASSTQALHMAAWISTDLEQLRRRRESAVDSIFSAWN